MAVQVRRCLGVGHTMQGCSSPVCWCVCAHSLVARTPPCYLPLSVTPWEAVLMPLAHVCSLGSRGRPRPFPKPAVPCLVSCLVSEKVEFQRAVADCPVTEQLSPKHPMSSLALIKKKKPFSLLFFPFNLCSVDKPVF